MFEASGVRVEALAPSGRKVLRRGKRQILLIAAGQAVFAVAARCPHEGYPLSEGTLGEAGAGSDGGGGCLLTCDWHNWKFDLATGAAVVGRDPVRTFPVEVRQGEIFLDLTDPPPDQLARRAVAGLEAAMDDDDPARMAREVARLERAGGDARGALVRAIAHTAGRLEGGMTHAHAAAADWLALRERAPDPDQRLVAMVEPIAHPGPGTPSAPAGFPIRRRCSPGTRRLSCRRWSWRTRSARSAACAGLWPREWPTLTCGRR